MGTPVGEPGGVRFPGLFERQMKEGSGNGASLIKLIWATLFWGDPDNVRSLSVGAIWNFSERPGLP
jgi:hypothetical protein